LTKDQKIADLELRLSDLGDRFARLMAAFEAQGTRMGTLEDENAKLKAENAKLREENAKLREALAVGKVKKNSSNSSMNPASDLNREKRTNLRDKTDLKVGGQTGHTGETLAMVENPDEVEECWPSACAACTMPLCGIDGVVVATAQVTKIPPIVPIVHEYQKIAVRLPQRWRVSRGGGAGGAVREMRDGACGLPLGEAIHARLQDEGIFRPGAAHADFDGHHNGKGPADGQQLC
jgi:transposase